MSASGGRARVFAGAVLLTALAALAAPVVSLAAQGAALPPPLELRVPKPPTVATGGSGSFLAYELHVTNFAAQPVTLQTIDVVPASGGQQRPLLSVADSALIQAVARPAVSVTGADRLKIGGGLRAVVFLWVPVDGRSAPASIRHRVTVERGTGDSARTAVLEGPSVPVATETVVIGPPLRGGVWFTGNGPAPGSGHRRALIPIGGTPAIAQRFAIDYVRVGDDNKTFTGDQLKNESYHAQGAEAIAVANGTVVAVKDSIPENVPGITSRAVPITLETVGGNHVILDLGAGRYAFYAHLQPGSIRVKLGDRVTRGQVLGLVGNSGNSTEPHLHFHLSDGNSPLGSEGIPYRHDSF
ncbi:MAG TPA: M23 family metallopeptidase, partial [Gemmatimonadaceae bacterium]|nr:M23 family metallopeptidase [Gemmatimonadaceae bacterium]